MKWQKWPKTSKMTKIAKIFLGFSAEKKKALQNQVRKTMKNSLDRARLNFSLRKSLQKTLKNVKKRQKTSKSSKIDEIIEFINFPMNSYENRLKLPLEHLKSIEFTNFITDSYENSIFLT